jgi:hypothetical protein
MRGLLLLLALPVLSSSAEPRNGTVGGATPVTVFISVVPVQVAKVDVTVQNVFFDAYVTLSWQDEAVAECGPGGSEALPQPPDWTAWKPYAEFVNHVDDGTGSREFKTAFCGVPFPMRAGGVPLSLGAYNWVNFFGRISGTFVAQMEMRDFPQDTQTVVLQLESDFHDAAGLAWEFLPMPSQVDFVHAGWVFLGAGSRVAPHYYPAFGLTYAQANFQLRLQRDPGYYYMRYVLNIMLLVAMSLLGAILSPLETSRIMLSVTLFLGVVSWMFVLVVDAPKSDQPTRMDQFFLASFTVLLLQALYFTLRNHNYDATLAPLPFWKGWLARDGGRSRVALMASPSELQRSSVRRRGRRAAHSAMASSIESPPSEEADGATAPGLPPAPDLAPDAPQPPGKEEARGDEGEAGAARSGTREQQEAEFVKERVRESVVVNLLLVVVYGAWVAFIFLLP